MEYEIKRFQADAAIIGGGVAGLSAALGLKNKRVIVLTKSEFGRGGSTPIAQGGIACAMGKDDTPELHAVDTMIAGDGLSIKGCVDVLTREGPARIRELIEVGAQFDRTPDGELSFGREAAHSRRRILHAHGDSTGAEVQRALTEAVRRAENIQVIENCYVVDIIRRDGRVIGVYGIINGTSTIIEVASPAVVLACGGIGRIYQYTTNPVESVGDALAIAARAGAVLSDVEFVQFHPTALNTTVDPLPLLTEALRGEGAVLLADNKRFMVDLHKDAELAPRDVVARGIWAQQQKGLPVFLDARCVGEKFPEKFPTVYSFCQQAGLDPVKDLLPVSPAAHYHMGGVRVDESGRTTCLGLWACGECCATGVHGANRLASNSLLEGLVFGARVSQDIVEQIDWTKPTVIRDGDYSPVMQRTFAGPDEEADASLLRKTMWDDVGLVRCEASMTHALSVLDELSAKKPKSLMLRNMIDAARIITTAALDRKESRGGHYRSDYPEHDAQTSHHPFVFTGNGPWC
ncbi:MAG: L-aspartate oxidase [Proteobacteria bacterium]|nr:L-aspartate oxidase [Pseudomonadota bacterium]